MIFEQRTVAGSHIYWPKPEVVFDEQEGLLIVATPWGPRSRVKKVIQVVTDYFVSSQTDQEVTSPFSRLTNLSTTANNLRIALLLANEALYNEDNKDEYTFGLEIFVGSLKPRELAWAQVGHPHVWLNRPTRGIFPLLAHMDLSAEWSSPGNLPAPLPSQLLGMDPSPHIQVQSFRPQANDQLVLLNHSWPLVQRLTANQELIDLDTVVQRLATPDGPPFWVGILNNT